VAAGGGVAEDGVSLPLLKAIVKAPPLRESLERSANRGLAFLLPLPILRTGLPQQPLPALADQRQLQALRQEEEPEQAADSGGEEVPRGQRTAQGGD
jgi:hypothetical protein